jgi:hypothetical protein
MAWMRQWILSLAFAFSAAYTIFDKVYPGVLPDNVVTSFSVMFLALALLQIYLQLRRRRSQSLKN